MSSLIISGQDGRRKICPNIDLILFDKDGTLIDIHHYWASIIRIRAQKITTTLSAQSTNMVDRLVDTMGVDLSSGRMKPEGPVGIKPRHFIVQVVSETVCNMGFNCGVENIEKIFKQVDEETERDLLPYLKLLPGVMNLLQQAKAHRIVSAIITTDITPRAKKAMAALMLDSFFESIIGGDQVKNHKPAPDIALLSLDRLGIPPDRAIVIGDHPVDIEMGIQSGIRWRLGVLTGLAARSSFENFRCDVVNTLEDLQVT